MAGIFQVRQTAGKAIAIDQFPPEAWTMVMGGEGGEAADLERLWRVVPWLNRGVGILANAITNIPFVILNERGEEVDSSQDYQNVIGLWEDPFHDLWLMEASLALFGRSVWLIEERGRGRMTMPAGLRYFVPSTVKPLMDADRGLYGYRRAVSGRQPEAFDVDELLYIKQPDPYGEIGDPKWSRAIAAMAAAGVLSNVDEFAADFFKKGMIKTTLLRVQGNPPPAELERVKSIWGRLMKGAKTAFESLVVRSEGVEPVTIGEGIGELANTDLTSEKREDISTALGVPQSMLFSNASNFAVKEGDKRDLYEEGVIPDARIIAAAINKQYLAPQGYRLQFRHTEMDIFQEDEEDRSGVVLNLTNALLTAPPKVASLVWQVAGVELPGGMEYDEFERLLEDVERAPVEQDAPPPTLTPAEGSVPESEDDPDAKVWAELDKWHRKASKRVKKNRTASTPWNCDYIPADVANLISEMLEEATTSARVHEIFNAAKGVE